VLSILYYHINRKWEGEGSRLVRDETEMRRDKEGVHGQRREKWAKNEATEVKHGRKRRK